MKCNGKFQNICHGYLLLQWPHGGLLGKLVTPTTQTANLAADDTLQVEVTLRNFYFEPSRIITEVDKPLKLTLKKRSGFFGIIPHDFNLTAPDADLNLVEQKVAGGKGVTIILSKVGEYIFLQ